LITQTSCGGYYTDMGHMTHNCAKMT